ncbi:MAG: SDR family NAD(P)-dependent oxidoreductase [Thermoleophilia bacterium]|nr:SDR family NAD(P)-dependent oxidoreductase [Thermoleophilia bacterium]MDH3724605.1 SDR family NAD(P)-dependent oxidoreductase [Thermoleophilia bacterium]
MSAVPVAVVFGARNVGRAVVAERLEAGWAVVAMVRTQATADALLEAHPQTTVLVGDASRGADVERVLAAAEDLGDLELIVNAITAPPRDQGFGGGPIADAPEDRLRYWMDGFVPMAWQIIRLGTRALRSRGGGTVVQVAGGSARRSFPGGGPWGAAQHAVKALIQSLAAESREHGVHVALLIADGFVETERRPIGDDDPRSVLHPYDLAAAAAYLHGQSPRGWTHELTLTPALEPWTP